MSKDEIKLPTSNTDFSSLGLVLEPSGSFVTNNETTNQNDNYNVYTHSKFKYGVNWLNYVQNNVEISNSHVIDPSLVIDEIIDKTYNQEFVNNNVKIKVVKYDHLISLAIGILRIATKLRLSQADYAFVLCPLRGVIKPATQLLASEAIIRAEWLIYTGGSNFSEYEVAQLQTCLRNIMKKYDAKQLRKFAILDTAISGYGICRLIDILNELRSKCYSSEFWQIEVFLLSDGRIFEENLKKLSGFGMDRFVVITNITKVESLVFEDWNSALGVQYVTDGTGTYAMPINEPGQYIYVDSTKVNLYLTENIRGSLDKLLADVISQEMNTNPEFRFLRNK